MNYYIGGPARVGKSVLAERIRHATDGERVHLDALKKALVSTVTAETHPDIFIRTVDPLRPDTTPDEWVDRLYRRDRALWPYFQEYVAARNRMSPKVDQIMEGNIWPDIPRALGGRAVFMVDTSEPTVQFERLKLIRDGDSENNWMTTYSDEKLSQWAVQNLARSLRYKTLCEQEDEPYSDIADGGIEAASDRAFEYLLGKEV